VNIYRCAQGSPEWHALHVGIPTSSSFDKIIQPKKLKPSASQDKYLDALIGEWLLGRRIETQESDWMQRGKELEPEAVAWYEMDRGVDAELVGFITRDDGMVGSSPDRLIGTDGLLEVKNPMIETHLGYMRDPGLLRDEYVCQVQGQLLVSERAWCDLLSFSPRPDVPPVVLRVERDEKFLDALSKAVDAFVVRLLEARASLLARGAKPSPIGHQDAPRSYGKALEEAGVTDAERQAWV
jgi:hypothetical protein